MRRRGSKDGRGRLATTRSVGPARRTLPPQQAPRDAHDGSYPTHRGPAGHHAPDPNPPRLLLIAAHSLTPHFPSPRQNTSRARAGPVISRTPPTIVATAFATASVWARPLPTAVAKARRSKANRAPTATPAPPRPQIFHATASMSAGRLPCAELPCAFASGQAEPRAKAPLPPLSGFAGCQSVMACTSSGRATPALRRGSGSGGPKVVWTGMTPAQMSRW